MDEIKTLVEVRNTLKEQYDEQEYNDSFDHEYKLNYNQAMTVKKLIKDWFNSQYGVKE